MADVDRRATAALEKALGERSANLPNPLAWGELETRLQEIDQRIDEHVYLLYGITEPEEIALIEEIAG